MDCSSNDTEPAVGIAIIGMAGRFPGAQSVGEFWRNQLSGLEKISRFSVSELEIAKKESLSANPAFVPARSILENIDQFDPEFFGIYPREAVVMDPQHRLFLECCWEAFEAAGHDPTGTNTGVYAGCSVPTYLINHLCRQPGFIDRFTSEYQVGSFPELVGNGLDFLSSKVSYKLDLRGPSVTMVTACSTSLVAVVHACQALLTYQCDTALAGGSSISLPQRRGTLHVEGGMTSSDGHCRAFDNDADGTVFGSGTAVVLLKRLEDAVRDGDTIISVIRGFGINNDGATKVGFTAPSIEGQARAIATAHELAGFAPDTIGYVEAHGTGTPLGDPIELTALSQVFSAGTDKKQFCTIGTAKTNIGHLDVAAGVTGLIHAANIVQNGVFPPTLHYKKPNAKFDLDNSPFTVRSTSAQWPDDGRLRRAGVSAFGVGGTNAHVVIEQAPHQRRARSNRPAHLLPLSARSEVALDRMCANLAEHLRQSPDVELADVAWTLQTGRRRFAHARTVVASSIEDAISGLTGGDERFVSRGKIATDRPELHFLFPGQGTQHVGMGRDLYAREPVFAEAVDACADILTPLIGHDLRTIMFAPEIEADEAQRRLKETAIAQPAIFTIEYALARLWLSWGVKPAAMIGHSVGEFAAACIAGVFPLEAALAMIAARGRLMQALPAGGMLSVRLEAGAVADRLPAGLSIAAVNAPKVTVVAGPLAAIEAFKIELDRDGISNRQLVTSHAFHSAMMDEVVAPFRSVVAQYTLSPPDIPIISCVTGEILTAEQATDPDYWARHLREPVRFADAAKHARENAAAVLLEVGPGNALSTMARMLPGATRDQVITSSLAGPGAPESDTSTIQAALGTLWIAGIKPDWTAWHGAEAQDRRRTPLPTYPFERKRYWVDIATGTETSVPAASSPSVISEPPPTDQSPNPRATAMSNASTQNPSEPAAIAAPAPAGRAGRIRAELVAMFEDLSGSALGEVPAEATFLELGFDSLFLTQAARELQNRFGLKIAFRQLLGDLGTFDSLSAFADAKLPADKFAPATEITPAAPPPVAAAAPAQIVTVAQPVALTPAPSQTTVLGAELRDGASSLERLMRNQLQMMNQVLTAQLDVLRSAAPSAAVASAPASHVIEPVPAPLPAPPLPKSEAPAPAAHAAASTGKTYTPYKPLQKGRVSVNSEAQEAKVREIVQRYAARTAKSKELTQAYRKPLADPRVVSGFRENWKEIVYPVITNRSKGAYLWDVDGNRYVDLLNGFGPIMFGHRPDFLLKAVETQLQDGFEIGPQSPLAGEIAELFCEITGNDRMTFCNTGSEAVMAAFRVARTVTGRKKIVSFAGDYHGMFDEVLIKPGRRADTAAANPIAPGIPPESVANMVVLDYGTPESLEWIRTHANELAAVIVEPIQSRRPDFAPVEFLKEVREITTKSGTALIFDEVVTGFRLHPGGAQQLFGIRADMATYGKVLGGGMPIGVLAGKHEFLDALDGGMWQFGDDSVPEVGVTFFAGTFVRHPLTLAAVKAVLEEIKARGAQLQQDLGARTSRMVARINAALERYRIPTRLESAASFMYFGFPSEERFAPLFYYLLRERGVHVLEGFPCFMTTAHSDADIDLIVSAFEGAAREMREASMFASGAEDGDRPEAVASVPAPVSAVPLTGAQREILLAATLGDDVSLAFNESLSVRLRGKIDLDALNAALNDVVARHESLRSTVDIEAIQLVPHPKLDISPARHDLSRLPAIEREGELARVLALDASTPFDLMRGPLIRAGLVTLEPELHVLVLTMHHIVCDGWSCNVILGELAELYSARVEKRPARLDAPASFFAHARSESGHDRTTSEDEVATYWLGQFKDVPVLPDLPTDRPRGQSRTYAGTTIRHEIGKVTHQAIKKLGAAHGASLFATLYAGVTALVARLSGQTDIVVGVPMAGQAKLDGGPLVGHCVNFLPLRLNVDMQSSFAALIAQAKDRVLDAYDHQDFTYGTLLQKLSIPRDPSRLPLTELQFNLEQVGAGARFAGLEAVIEANPKAAVNSDIFFNMVEKPTGLTVECDYNTDLFDEQTIRDWLGALTDLLVAAAEAPGTTVAELPLAVPTAAAKPARGLSSADRELLAAWNQTTTTYPSESSIADLFREQVARSPNAPALVCNGETVTYDQLNRRANRIAHQLKSMGLGREDMVACCLPRSIDLIVTVLGIVKAGCAYVPLETTFPRERIEFMLRDTRARVLITYTSIGLADLGVSVLSIDRDDCPAWQQPENDPESTATASSLAYVMYTSGSTGRPKGVMVEHRAVVRLVRNTNYCRFAPDEAFLCYAPMSFDASTFEVWGALLNGARLVIVPASDTALSEVGRCIRENGVTAAFLTSGLFHLLVEQRLDDLKGLRCLLAGGEVLSARHVRMAVEGLPGCTFSNIYGPTEATTFSTFHPLPHGTAIPDSVPIGRPISNARIYVLDEELRQVPIGEEGELFIAGDGLARGYLNNPDLTAQKFVTVDLGNGRTERLYRTGDHVALLPGGEIDFRGRIDNQIKLRGFRIELGEIEVMLQRHPDVHQACVVAERDGGRVTRLLAFCIPVKGHQIHATVLSQFLGSKLPAFMVPASIMGVEGFPLNSNGKIDRARLLAREAANRRERVIEEPATTDERNLVQIVKEVTRIERVGVTDNLFELGVDSLKVFQIASRASKLGLSITPRAILQARTVRAALAQAQQAGAAAPASGPAIRPAARQRIKLSPQGEKSGTTSS